MQRASKVMPAAILAPSGDLLIEHRLDCDRFDDGGYVRRTEALRQLLQALRAQSGLS